MMKTNRLIFRKFDLNDKKELITSLNDENVTKWMDSVPFPYLEKHNIKTLIHLGDVVDRRKFINFKILNDLRTNFIERLWKMGVDTHIII